jgi:pyruvate/2-oxoglutarate dehydrogenase complex dihydrolipoamide dehydrogenase (E3) component
MADHILGRGADNQPHAADGPNSPQVIFTEPQVARVGYTLAGAEEAGLTVEAYDTSTAGNAGASFVGRNTEGTTRWVVDTDRGVVVGSTITGPDVQEFLHAATIAVVGEVPLHRLRHAVPAFPTRSENWLQLLDKAGV